MEVEKDFIKREIQKLILLLNSLIEKVSKTNSGNAKSSIQEISEALKSEFDLSLRDITQMENSALLKHIEKLHESHIEKIIELIYNIVISMEISDFSGNFKKNKMAKKAILLIDFLNENSKTFSIKRMNMKNTLQQRNI